MDFSFTEEQNLLADSVRRYLDDRHHFEARKQLLKAMSEGAAHSPSVWNELAGLGVLALLTPEAEGGLNGGAFETLVVAQALGRSLVVEPFLGSAVVATRAIALLGTAEQRSQWLPAMAEGHAIVVPVLGGTAASTDAAVAATASADGWVLNGKSTAVYHAPAAQAFVVAARTAEGVGAADALFLVPANSAGLQQTAYATVDSQSAADLAFNAVPVAAAARLGADLNATPNATSDSATGNVTTTLAALADLALFTLCAEALGSMEQAVALTVDYTRNRQQFGVPLARFQVLQHRMVDMQTQVEQARSLVYLAASLIDAGDSRSSGSESARDSISRTQAVAAMQVLVLEATRYVSQQAVQLHGGMGVTDEMAISHHFKRLLATGLRCGTAAQHLDRYASLTVG
jgi:alkylation response protein AidB-like acyl-CoA dehydrogenase